MPPVSQLPIPKDFDDHENIVALSDRLLDQGRSHRWIIERDMFRNILFYLGRQWISYDARHHVWLPRALDKNVPRPVTNKFASTLRPIVSLLAGEEPNLYFRPETDVDDDKATANVASRAVDLAIDETGLAEERTIVARWLVLTGNVFYISGYDPRGDGITKIPLQQCPSCGAQVSPLQLEESNGACPQCGATTQDAGPFSLAMDANGVPVVASFPRGRMYTEIASPFEMYADLEAGSFRDSPWAQRVRTRSRQWVSLAYGEEIAAELPTRGGDGWQRGRYFLESLAYATAQTGSPTVVPHASDTDRIEVRDFWYEHPTIFPNGLHAVIVGRKVMSSGPYEYQRMDAAPDKPKPMRPIVHIQYERVPGRLFGKTPADDLALKQLQRNRYEAAIELHTRRMSNAVWIIPEGSNVTKITGEHGIMIRYQPLQAGATPNRLPGTPLERTLIERIAQIDNEMEDLAGTYDVIRGETPPRISAYAAVQFLAERGQQGFSEMLVNWSNGHKEWARQILGIFKVHGVDDRFVSALGDNGLWAVEKFTNSDLRGAVRIEVEAGLGRPRSQIGKRAVLEQAIRLAAVNVTDPFERLQVLQILGMPELLKSTQVDQQAAARENDRFMQLDGTVREEDQSAQRMAQQLGGNGGPGMPADPRIAMTQQAVWQQLPWPKIKSSADNHLIHIEVHRRLVVSERFDLLSPVTQQALLAHLESHVFAVQMAMQQVQGQGAPLGKQAGGPAAGDGSEGNSVDEEIQEPARRGIGEKASTVGPRAQSSGGGGGGSVHG